ncbi:heavy metal translocating P-type ATPase metal-binding domain-containing protein [Methylosarcina fibrata]|uniref:heavy metal translocating P-type ATPase metal-binding domain-containing protein n=1 Tax=Methylosarcina fibrata TaxID=105972 RepID=UPI00037F8F9C|nr:heavy metal translocating P-type ATPase metal-binding domain-containing protein [Methylosarcina fibrata]
MGENTKACDLCGLPVEIEGFKLRTKEGDKAFCCEGCKGIYQMLHEETVLDVPDQIDETE